MNRTRQGLRGHASVVIAGVGTVVAIQLLTATPAYAALSFIVNSAGNEGDFRRDGVCETVPGNKTCTLQAAITESNNQVGVDEISFRIPTSDPKYDHQTGAYTITAALVGLDLTDGVNISGPGATKLIVRGGLRIFNVTSSGTVTLSGMTIFGSGVGASNRESGGGLRNVNNGIVNLTNCVFTQNKVASGLSVPVGGGAIFNASTGHINVTSSTFVSNGITGSGSSGVAGGAAIYNKIGSVNITNSTFVDNHSAGVGGAVLNEAGIVTISGSTFRDNDAYAAGGGVANGTNGTMSISNSTFYANIAFHPSDLSTIARPGGSGGAISNTGRLDLTNSTLTANFAGRLGSGLYNSGTVNIKSTIIAQNFGGMEALDFGPPLEGPDVFGPFVSQGFNLIGRREGSTGFTAATDKKGTIASPLNPKFDTRGLRNNGGPTETVALTSSSPATDKGTSLGLTGILTTDQRSAGFLRKVDKSTANATGGDGTDIGAYELQ